MHQDWDRPEFARRTEAANKSDQDRRGNEREREAPINQRDIESKVAAFLAKKGLQSTPVVKPTIQPTPEPKEVPEPVQQYMPTVKSTKGSRRSSVGKPEESFYIALYKTSRDLNRRCPGLSCRYWHDETDRRRAPNKYGYFPELCPVASHCPLAQMCVFAHNQVEVDFHPSRFKTNPCRNTDCLKDIHCPNLHPGDKISTMKTRTPDTLEALASLNLLLSESSNIPAERQHKFIQNLTSQIDRLKPKLSCQACQKDLVFTFWVPCLHAVCQSCAKLTTCRADGSTRQYQLIL